MSEYTSKQLMDYAEEYMIYGKKMYPAVMDRGDGVYLYDKEGKAYLDFVAGIAVNALGYKNEEYLDALKAQMDKVMHISRYFHNEPAIIAAKRLVELSGMSQAFFANSGTEAIEGALKVAKKHASMKPGADPDNNFEVIAMHHSFHGRSMAALAATDNLKYQGAFVPSNVRAVFAEFNNLSDVISKVTDKTCGIICEVMQGEGGVYPADKEFLEGLRELCDEKDIILIFDEVQCGMGRLGTMFAHEAYGVKPDVLALAKALGGGVPVGAFLISERCKGVLGPGEHGNTYGANPFCMAAINAVLDLYEKYDVLSNVKNMEKVMEAGFDKLRERHPETVLGHRGKGLLQGLIVTVNRDELELKLFEKGLLVCAAGTDVIRFLPPLVVTEDEINKAIEIMDEALSEMCV